MVVQAIFRVLCLITLVGLVGRDPSPYSKPVVLVEGREADGR